MQFRETVLKLICGYKKIIKRQLPQGAASKKFEKFGIKSRQLAKASDVDLYHTCSIINDSLAQEMRDLPSTYEYSGIVAFKKEVSKLLDTYILKNNTVTNKSFAGSRALLHAIQLITAPVNHKNNDKLEENINDLMNYGTREQLAKIIHTLQKQGSSDQNSYFPYLEPLRQKYKSEEQRT